MITPLKKLLELLPEDLVAEIDCLRKIVDNIVDANHSWAEYGKRLREERDDLVKEVRYLNGELHKFGYTYDREKDTMIPPKEEGSG